MKIKAPLISVVMSVYNDELYLREAISSILNQTFSDVEFIIIDDGSTDSTWKIIKSFSDKRIIALQNSKNQGLSYSLNKGIKLAKGKYIARMDGDDISLPQRFELQIKFLEKHPEVGVLGTHLRIIDDKKPGIKYPTTHERVRIFMLYGSPVGNPSAIIRASLLRDNLYDISLSFAQDYDLWVRLADHTKFANIDKFLVLYRIGHRHNPIKNKFQRNVATTLMIKLLIGLGIDNREIDLSSHLALAGFKKIKTNSDLENLISWCKKIIIHNKSRKNYNQNILKTMLLEQCAYHAKQSSLPIAKKIGIYFKSLALLII